MRSIIIATILTVAGLASLSAQAPDVAWTKTFGDSLSDWAWYVEETSDSGYVVTGYISTPADGYWDIYIVKLKQNGDPAWSKTYGVEDCVEIGQSAKETSDGGLIVAGYKYGNCVTTLADYDIMKLDGLGNIVWEETYDYDTTADYAYDICQTLDGGYIIVGHTYYYSDSLGEHDWGTTIAKIDAAGHKLNHVLEVKSGTQYPNRVVATSDSGAVAVGSAGGIYLIKIDKNGNIDWTKGYGTGSGWGILELPEGGYMAFGDRGGSYPNYDDFWLLRLDTLGDTLWSKRYGYPADNSGYGLDQTADGGFIMCGEAFRNAGAEPLDMYIIRTNANGDTLWTKTVGGDRYEYAYCVKQTFDGGYIVVGRSDSNDPNNYDFYIVKLNPDNPSAADDIAPPRPTAFSLGTNYPNPFNPGTTIEYTLGRRAMVRIDIINLLGQTVCTLVHDLKEAGSHRITWNGTDDAGKPAATGVYLYRLQADGAVQARKMLLLK